MYKIIGSDGKEYGPITLEQLKQWLAEGRLNHDSKVQVEGETAWRTLRDLPELMPTLQSGLPPQFTPVNSNQTEALKLVRGPAIFILVLAILNVLACLWGLIFSDVEAQLEAIPNMPPETMELVRKVSFLFGVPANLFGIAMAITCIFGSLQMMKLRTYGFALAAAIIMLIPCGTCCCCLNIGAGIWALVVLCKQEVKSAFQ